MANRAERRASQRAKQEDPYEAGVYDNEEIGDDVCGECDDMPVGWCRTCHPVPDGRSFLCINHLSAHCIEHQHVAWVVRLKDLHEYMEEQQSILYDAVKAITGIHVEMHNLDTLQARGYLSFPKKDTDLLAAIEDARDKLADECDAAYEQGAHIRHRLRSAE